MSISTPKVTVEGSGDAKEGKRRMSWLEALKYRYVGPMMHDGGE